MLFRVFTVLAVIALAISTWILSTPDRLRRSEPAARQGPHPGYYLTDAVLTDYGADGAPSVRIQAARIDEIGRGNQVALHDIHVTYAAPGGESWVMSGDRARIEPDGKAVDVQGNVQLRGVDPHRPGTAIIRSDRMRYDVADAVASTPEDVRIEFGGETLSAHGLLADLKRRTVRLESDVNGHFVP
ncbi:MAG: LPS export ABC transporter periplasmic protein LptC [Gammaproteobacteria bacterium]|nr:LPS export ABC transporter periplasmic protein LptC [Gammaproteobacteria bacterium]